jgi:hypothetical protein
MFPVWINDGTSEMPTDPIFYIVAKDGIYLKKTMGDFDTMNKVDAISILGECASYASLNVAKIATRQFAQILSLFREVYKVYKSEANVILHYNKKRKRYRIDVPLQGVTGASVNYVNGEDTYKDYIRIGTIHSHASMSAFHSGTDHKDEENWDGLHITLGKMNEDYFDISCSIMTGGERFMVNPEEYIDGIELVEYEVQHTYQRYKWIQGKQVPMEAEKKLGYRCNAPEKDFIFPKKWMDKIDRPKYTAPKYPNQYSFGGYGGGSIGEFYRNNSTQLHQSPQQRSLFDSYEVNPGDWNPCGQCPYRHHKSDLMMKDLIDSLDDESAKLLGFEVIDEDDISDPFYVDENPTFGCDIDDPEQDGPTFGSTKNKE